MFANFGPNLLKVLGPQGGLWATYAMLAVSLLLVLWWERHFFARKAAQQSPRLQTV